jgi:beta-galactosidase
VDALEPDAGDRFSSLAGGAGARVRRGRQFVTTDYGGMMKRDVNEEAVADSLDIVADNIYHGTQDHYDGSFQALQSDFSRSLKHGIFW